MQLQFDSQQQFQIDAVESVVDVLDGLAPESTELRVANGGGFAVFANVLNLSEESLLSNLVDVQERNGIDQDDGLHLIAQPVETIRGTEEWRFPNLSVEMETGTGKTYVYVRTCLELNRRFGLRKYIIVVPTVAIREGVIKTFSVTAGHFADLYENVPYNFYTYDSGAAGVIRQFASSNTLEFMVMTIDSFNKASNIIHRGSDLLQGEQPISLIQETEPVLILDEPQNMGSETAIAALTSLCPSLSLRYRATHREPYNLVYRLTPLDAYRAGLVKHIEVAGIEREADANKPFLRLMSIRQTQRTTKATFRVQVLRAAGGVRERSVTTTFGTSLEEETERSEYSGYTVDEINPGTCVVRFTNNVQISEGSTQGDDKSAIFNSQIRYTIREHFLKQKRLRPHGIKVLSLFFLDRVASYEGEDPIVHSLFVAAFDEMKQEFDEWKLTKADDVQAAYFAHQRRRDGRIEAVDSASSASTDQDAEAFALIMRDKERLLSFDTPVAFIFSHSALREGWDNPNVFQICTLNQSISEIRKRQEIGRGLRLAVDQQGARVLDPAINVLTVVANESYESYVERYQAEVEELDGDESAVKRVRNARLRTKVRIRDEILTGAHFKTLWSAVSPKTRYTVALDTNALLDDVTRALAGEQIRPVRVRVSKGRVVATTDGFSGQTVAGLRTLETSDAHGSVDALIKTMADQLDRLNPPVFLTRRTLAQVFERETRKELVLANPHEWASTAVRLIRESLADQLVEGVVYERTGEAFDLARFENETESWEDRLIRTERGLYDYVAYDSEIERRFVENLEADERILTYLKLPPWFSIDTPVGRYNPDWAMVRQEQDEHGTAQGARVVVVETKSVLLLSKLRPDEKRKIGCGRAHFQALGVRFAVARSLADLEID